MRNLNFYVSKGLNSEEAVFKYLTGNFHNLRTWDYFVNWEKVFFNLDKFKTELNHLNSLCGSINFDNQLKRIVNDHPEVVKVFPILLAARDTKISILDSSALQDLEFKEFDFDNPDMFISNVETLLLFFEKSGLKRLIVDGGITNLRDYVLGVEVGLDTNGRKNRVGTFMEGLIEKLLQNIYGLNNSEYMSQGSPQKVKELWNIVLPVDKASRVPDFLVYKNSKLFWIETNFYSGSGSKLKSTCGEYKSLFNFCKNHDVEFVWITDGEGWKTALRPLRETFINNDYIFNISMVKDGILEDLWS